ncbi:hypothetical protein KKG72_08720 [bacterium]|nr:hypothetical protein [bacterium]MBU1995151.1 hypothetical protein [bacterium]
MTKVIQAFLSGVFFTFILDFFIFLGIKLHYIDFYEIDLYYNILFADNQNIFIYFICTAGLGYLVTYTNNIKRDSIILGVFFLIAASTLIAPIGKALGEAMFMEKNVTLKNAKYTFRGDVYYEGRQIITFYDYELQKVILLKKKDLIQ